MYDTERYRIDPGAVEAFIAEQRHGTLMAAPPGGHPQASLLPFLKRGELIELHCVQEDPTFAAVRANPLVTFLVSDFLAFSRHDWVNPVDGGPRPSFAEVRPFRAATITKQRGARRNADASPRVDERVPVE